MRYNMTPGSTAENGKPTNANTKTSTTQHRTPYHIIRSQCTSPCKLAQVNTQHTTLRTQNRTDHTHRHTSPLNTMHDTLHTQDNNCNETAKIVKINIVAEIVAIYG